MSSEKSLNSSDTENACVVCFKNTEIYSVGTCEHPVCFECSTRMRVLCRQNECPICRQDMPQVSLQSPFTLGDYRPQTVPEILYAVIFTKDLESFSSLSGKLVSSNLSDRKAGILFHTSGIQQAYLKLLQHSCNVCNSKGKKCIFKTFQQLKDHMRREHELFYCDLCVDNLKIFTFERKCYSRKELAQHRRKGDADNTSHRGHPLCEFCDTRYVDSDELFRHLRRDHLFCHFCDADGKHEFYSSYQDLRGHFQEKHYLCEEGNCKNEILTAVFRTDIDLKAHFASVHGRNLSKSATRQARTLELEFTLAPRQRLENSRSNSARQGNLTLRDEDNIGVGYDLGFSEASVKPNVTNRNNSAPLSSSNFPVLGSGDQQQCSVARVTFSKSKPGEPLRAEDFPVLGGNNRVMKTEDTTNRKQREIEATLSRTISGQQNPYNVRNKSDFPALCEPSTSGTKSTLRVSVNTNNNSNPSPIPNVSIQVKHKTNGSISTSITADAFPALGNAEPVVRPQWVPVKSKSTQKLEPAAKAAPAPVLPPSSLSEFPVLSKSEKKNKKSSSKVTVPITEDWVNLNNLKSEGNNRNEVPKPPERTADPPPDPKLKTKKKKPKPTADEPPMNGIMKKRSELKIDPLNSSSPPPPGFTVRPPPGFQGAPVISGNDLTFTNSTGQSYLIRPITRYHQPDDFASRNRNLIEKFMGIVKDNRVIKEFKSYSDMFRNGTLNAERFYEHCKVVMGDSFDEVFPELLVLLPDVEKQQALFTVHQKCTGDRSKRMSLMTCPKCKQVVLKKELDSHKLFHEEKVGED